MTDAERLYPPRSVRLSNDKVSFVIKNWKLIKNHLVTDHELTFLFKKRVPRKLEHQPCPQSSPIDEKEHVSLWVLGQRCLPSFRSLLSLTLIVFVNLNLLWLT